VNLELLQSTVLAGIFAVAAIQKARLPARVRVGTLLVRTVESSAKRIGVETRVDRVNSVVWWLLVAIEGSLAVLLLIPESRFVALIMAGVFLLLASAAILRALISRSFGLCGCFGARGRTTPWTLGRSAWLCASAVISAGFPEVTLGTTIISIAVIDTVVLVATADPIRREGLTRVRSLLSNLTDRVRIRVADPGLDAFLSECTYWKTLRSALKLGQPSQPWRQEGWVMRRYDGWDDRGDVAVVAAIRVHSYVPWVRILTFGTRGGNVEIRASWDSISSSWLEMLPSVV
jgi:hypothetical protein